MGMDPRMMQQAMGQGGPQGQPQMQQQPQNPPAQVDPGFLMSLLAWIKQNKGIPQGQPTPQTANQLLGPQQTQAQLPQMMQALGQAAPPPQVQQQQAQQQQQQQQQQADQAKQQSIKSFADLLKALNIHVG